MGRNRGPFIQGVTYTDSACLLQCAREELLQAQTGTREKGAAAAWRQHELREEAVASAVPQQRRCSSAGAAINIDLLSRRTFRLPPLGDLGDGKTGNSSANRKQDLGSQAEGNVNRSSFAADWGLFAEPGSSAEVDAPTSIDASLLGRLQPSASAESSPLGRLTTRRVNFHTGCKQPSPRPLLGLCRTPSAPAGLHAARIGVASSSVPNPAPRARGSRHRVPTKGTVAAPQELEEEDSQDDS